MMMGERPVPRLHLLDAVAFLQRLPDASVDLILTDPAYESLEKHRAKGTTTRLKNSKASSNDWFPIFPNSRFPEFFAECHRVLASRRHFYMLCDQETMFHAKPIAEASGFKFWKPIIWDKVSMGMGYHYRARYEVICFFEKQSKGKGRQLKDRGVPDILSFKRIRNGYPTEKPVPLLELLIKQSTESGELVIDPFMGSGSTCIAAIDQGREFEGSDVSVEAFKATLKRSEGGVEGVL